MTDLKDRIALVTGASRGLGFATAVELGELGAHVVAVARTVGGLENLDEAIRARGGEPATLVPLDICDDPALGRLGAAAAVIRTSYAPVRMIAPRPVRRAPVATRPGRWRRLDAPAPPPRPSRSP